VIIAHYGIKLIRLTKAKIELVRSWRNDEKIQRHMFFAQRITPEMQENWFASINNEFNHYFIIVYNGQEVGLINTSHIDFSAKKADAGLFIFEDKYWGTDVPVRASLAMLDFFFHHHILESIEAKTKVENKAAINYNKQLGFEQKKIVEDGNGILLELTKENYLKSTAALRKVAGSEKMIIEFDRTDSVERFFFEKYFQKIN
jgi:RimJ/RimL family protein N-acetyltransferase